MKETQLSAQGLVLAKGVSYNVSVFVTNRRGNSVFRSEVFFMAKGGSSSSSSAGPAVAGVIATAVVVTISIILIIIFIRWRRTRRGTTTVTKPPRPPPPPRKPVRKEEEEELEMEEIVEHSEDESDSEDSYVDVSFRSEVPEAEFPEYVRLMHEDRDHRLELEYRSLDKLPQPASDAAHLPCNIRHNRFKNIFPYDHSRVQLKGDPAEEGSDYINASFIDVRKTLYTCCYLHSFTQGYPDKKNAYIAPQGPTGVTVNRFWEMVWENEVHTIVMLTRCVEDAKEKCEQYWPQQTNSTETRGKFHITVTSFVPSAEYQIRKIHLQSTADEEGELTVTHMFYTAWPDHGVPRNAMSLISFIRRVRKEHPASLTTPLLVHCSAGVGRTGTFILLDLAIQQMRREGTLSVFQHLKSMRTQRIKMVQTQAQYVFIHDSLSELVVCGETEVAAGDLRIKMNRLHRPVPGDPSGLTGFQTQFQESSQCFWPEGRGKEEEEGEEGEREELYGKVKVGVKRESFHGDIVERKLEVEEESEGMTVGVTRTGAGRMRVLLVCLLACLHIVHCQTYPFLRHNGVTFQNNSFIDRGIVSVADKLECVTNHSPCCEGSDGGWTDPAEVAIQEGPAGTIPFYVTRTAAGTIDLNRLAVSNGQEQLSGMYECEIPGSGGTPEMMFIYLGNQSTGRDLVDYSCTVSSNRTTYFGEAGSSVSSEAFTVSAAGEPTRLNAVDLLSSGSILVTWTPPSGSVTGYTVFLEPGGSGTQYMVSLVALSDQLPSMVVGPLAPTNLEPPDVTLSAITTNPTGTLKLNSMVLEMEWMKALFLPPVTPSSGSYLAQYSFENLDLFSHGVYRCSATYTIEESMSPAGEATLNVDVTFGVNEPGLGLLECQFMWSRVGGELPPSASIGSVETGLFTRENTLTLSPLAQSDSGEYRCQVTISTSPGAGTIPTATLDESDVLTVLIPEVTVATEPETQRVLDHEEYNSFTITCSASATAGTTPLALGFVHWDRRVDSGEFQPVSTDSYSPLTGTPEDGYASRISGTESTASTTVQFRCTAALTETSIFSTTSTATVTVQGPAAPMSVSLRSTDVTDTTAIISWTVFSIAYTPETYTVLYGTTTDSLDRTSGQQRTSGSDISVTSLPLSLPLSGLDPDTAYYYTVNASNSYTFTLYETNTFNTSSRRPNPPTNLAVTQPSGLTYGFTWTASTAAPGAPPIVSYTLTCDPTLDGVDDVKRHYPRQLRYLGVSPTGAPVNLMAVAGRRNLMLSWSPPEPRLRNGDISSYTVTCFSPSSSSPDFSDTIPDTQVMATGLTPNTMYSCSVLATNSVGSGPSATVDASTLEDAPDAPPQDFRHSVVNGSQRVEFSWAPPPSSSANGAITGYAISCNPPFYQSTTELSLNVTTLTPGTSYSCNISASTAVGAGPPTTPLLSVLTVFPLLSLCVCVFSTRGTRRCQSQCGEEEKGEGLLVMWGQVEGIVTGYRLTVTKTSSGDTVVLTSSDPSLLVRSDKVGGFEMVSIEVSGVNLAGYGPPSDAVSGTTPSIPPGPVAEVNVAVEDGTLTVEWNTPPYPNASGPVALTPENQRRSSNGDILLSWEKPSPVEARGIITSFEISFSESGAGEGGRRKRQECPRDQCQLGAGNPPEDKGGFPVVIVAVLVVLVVAVVLPVVVIVVIVVIVVLIRCRKSKTGGYSAHPSAMPPGVDEDKRAEEMVSLSAINPTSPEEAARMRAIRLDQFEEHVRQMHEDRDKGFEQEYLTFNTEPTAVHDAAKDPKNKNKNRFANIFPYDFNRVPLQLVDGAEGSDYINASFVHGYSRSNAYIAAQGPMSGTILDFWRMIWEHRPGSIVMLTKLVEGGKRKCELYGLRRWRQFKPDVESTYKYKEEVVPYADFEIRKFIVNQLRGLLCVVGSETKGASSRGLQHSVPRWQDHGVPKFSNAIISFIRPAEAVYHNPQSAMFGPLQCRGGGQIANGRIELIYLTPR
ncbi:Receptor-type tyrosine-protein phosphatase S [Geodia barretti]|uniref:protein-tyrosine-phosphatase n=1 Tax=Geodia barretti TaxID=519541 RepID=A0AA35XE30_GEOBA|nr:Receptor-type tyrosine-protein phosphatase S [Geodia barretti]